MSALLVPLLLAVAVPYPWDSSFDELTFADASQRPACLAEFKHGQIGFSLAFDDDREGHPILIVSGRTTKRLRIGQRLFAKGQATIYHNALVVAASENSATIVTGQALIGHLLADQASSVQLMQSPADIDRAGHTLLSFADDDMINSTTKIATALACSFEEGI